MRNEEKRAKRSPIDERVLHSEEQESWLTDPTHYRVEQYMSPQDSGKRVCACDGRFLVLCFRRVVWKRANRSWIITSPRRMREVM